MPYTMVRHHIMAPLTAVLLLALVALASSGCRSPNPRTDSSSKLMAVQTGRELRVKSEATAGIKELSGLAVATRSGNPFIYVVGDKDSVAAKAPYVDDDAPLQFTSADHVRTAIQHSDQAFSGDSQWEAAALDGAGNLVVLRESDPSALLVFSSNPATLRAVIRLQVPAQHSIATDWNSNNNSKGEGLVLLKNGHVLLLKEKGPMMLIEFAPAGSVAGGYTSQTRLEPGESFLTSSPTLVPVKWWLPDDSVRNRAGDLSEIAVDGDGGLYALSDQSRVILAISGESQGEIARRDLLPDSTQFRANIAWTLPPELTGKPEGLVFVEGDRPIVALDDCPRSDKCIFTLSRLYN